MLDQERQGVRTEKRRRRVVEWLIAVGAIVMAFFVWFGVVALLR